MTRFHRFLALVLVLGVCMLFAGLMAMIAGRPMSQADAALALAACAFLEALDKHPL